MRPRRVKQNPSRRLFIDYLCDGGGGTIPVGTYSRGREQDCRLGERNANRGSGILLLRGDAMRTYGLIMAAVLFPTELNAQPPPMVASATHDGWRARCCELPTSRR